MINLAALIACALTAVIGSFAAAQSADWPQWRGPNRDGAAATFTPPGQWPEQLAPMEDRGRPQYASPILVGNRLFVFSRQGENEVMRAIEADTAKPIWQTAYPAPFTMNPAAARHEKGPKSTPAFANGRVYSLGMSGIVTAFDAATGRQLWQKPPAPVAPLYHTSMSPIVDRGLVVVHVGGHNQGALTAFDASSGAVRWSWNGDGPSYGSPMAADFEGTRQIVVFTQENLVGVSAATGELLWKRPFTTRSTQNTITPIFYGGTVIVSGLDRPVTAFRVVRRGSEWTTENVWENPDVPSYMTNAVVVRDMLVGMTHRNFGQFFALDAKTGKTLWTSAPRQATNAAILRAGSDLVFALKDDAELIVARPSASGLDPLKRYTVADSATWALPTVAGNRIYIKDTNSLALWTW